MRSGVTSFAMTAQSDWIALYAAKGANLGIGPGSPFYARDWLHEATFEEDEVNFDFTIERY